MIDKMSPFLSSRTCSHTSLKPDSKCSEGHLNQLMGQRWNLLCYLPKDSLIQYMCPTTNITANKFPVFLYYTQWHFQIDTAIRLLQVTSCVIYCHYKKKKFNNTLQRSILPKVGSATKTIVRSSTCQKSLIASTSNYILYKFPATISYTNFQFSLVPTKKYAGHSGYLSWTSKWYKRSACLKISIAPCSQNLFSII